MKIECKGIHYSSLFKYCFISIFIFSILVALIGYVGGLIYPENWFGPKGISQFSLSIIGKETIEGQVDTANSLKDLIIFLVIIPISATLSSIALWVLFLIGQFIYTYFYTYTLTMSNKGLSFLSSIKYSTLGLLWSLIPMSILFAFIDKFNNITPTAMKINGEPMGIVTEIIALTLFSILGGVVLGILMYIGQNLFSIYKPLNLEVIPYKNKSTSGTNV